MLGMCKRQGVHILLVFLSFTESALLNRTLVSSSQSTIQLEETRLPEAYYFPGLSAPDKADQLSTPHTHQGKFYTKVLLCCFSILA